MRLKEFVTENLNKLHDQAEYIQALKGFRLHHYNVPWKQAREHLDNYSRTVDNLIKNGGTVYRAVWVHPNQKPRLDNPGDHWTISVEAAEEYLQSNAGDSAYSDFQADNDEVDPVAYIIQATVGPNNITNRNVLIGNFPEELEVSLIKPRAAKINIVKRL